MLKEQSFFDFKGQVFESLPVDVRDRLDARGIFTGKDFFGKSVNIEEWGEDVYRYVSDQEFFEVSKNIVEQIDPLKYETLISDEVGGRHITRLMWEYINIKREEAGMSRLKNVFFLRPKDEDIPFVDAFIASRNNEDDKDIKNKSFGNTLVVTELIRNGGGTRRMGDILKKYKVKFDVASISAVKKDTIPVLKSEYGIEVMAIGEMNLLGTGEVLHRRSFNGVEQGDYHSGSAHPKKDGNCDQDKINLSRKIISLMAQRMANIVK